MENFFDLIVLGAGSGGLAAAKRAAKHGAKVAIVEGDRVGGTCVIRGCVPKKLLVYGSLYGEYIKRAKSFGVDFSDVKINSEVLLTNIRKEVNRLNELHHKFLSQAGVKLFKGWGEFKDKNTILVTSKLDKSTIYELRGNHILIAVGGYPIRPDVKGSSLGWVSDDMFELKQFPDNLVILGGGFIACEFSSILNSLGVKVTQLVRSKSLLREFDSELVNLLRDQMLSRGINLKFGQSLLNIEKKENNLNIVTSSGEIIQSKGILFAIGRNPCISALRLQKAGVKFSNNKVEVDINNRTNIPHIFAVGDVTNRINLTPVAIDEGRVFSDSIFANKKRLVNYKLIPKAVFSQPEFATVGLNEEEAITRFGKDRIEIFRTSFRPMSQSLANTDEKCLLKLICQVETGKIVGCHMLGEHSAEIIQMASISLGMGATKFDFDKTMALHPTIAEEFVTMNS